ncbi:MAG: hypothetical protein P1V97_30975 [Planctomycetota bacterium]|nr:hypothetical protein [Planctomycetota bacterium]
MNDSQLRELERRWQAYGAIEDYVRFQAERVRLGDLTPRPTRRLVGAVLALNELYRETGGVLDFGIFNSVVEPSFESHRHAILKMFDCLIEEKEQYIEETCARFGYEPNQFGRIRIDRRDFNCKRITLRQFLGWEYDSSRECLALRGNYSDNLNEYFTAPYNENDANCLCDYSTLRGQWDPALDLEEMPGIAYAFSYPPYGMGKTSNQDLNTLFHGICYVLFGGLSPELEILCWETNWSNYFEAGREWWGEYLWTVHRPGESTIAVIAGSSTD